jgi:hypothetical protein
LERFVVILRLNYADSWKAEQYSQPFVSIVSRQAFAAADFSTMHRVETALRSFAKPPRIWRSYRPAFVQSKQSLYASNYCPNKPPNNDQCPDRKVRRYCTNDQIEQPYPKRGYLKLKMRATYLVGLIPLQISDDQADQSCYAGEKSDQVQNVNG